MNRGEGTRLTAYFGLPHSAEARQVFAPNWNSTVGDRPAISSILLSHAVVKEGTDVDLE
ncbi:hypothetical protein [Pseudomonas sp. GL-B-26]|uniref:hypothetical protein n=1 Tax=Pseudomonas sp. GL-B-26 TaxID=2832394 RepID=UPI001CBDC75A|nr:hypothetical protein [Pseudomonas sp. GL-B-26]